MSRAPNANGAGVGTPAPLPLDDVTADPQRNAGLERLPETTEALEVLIRRLGGRASAPDVVAAMRAEWPHMRESYCQRVLVAACAETDCEVLSDDDGRTYALGHRPTRYLAAVPDVAAEPRPSRLKSAAERRDRPLPPWTVEDTLPEYGVGHLVGPAYTGKTYIGVDLALSLCNDSVGEWFGREVRRHGDVVYVLMEGAWDFPQRVAAWLEAHPGTSDDRLWTLEEEELNLGDAKSVSRLAADVQALDLAPVLLVVDTQSLATAGIDENDNSKMSAVFGALKWLAKRLGCVVLAVHHTGHNGDRARGASAQFAAVDVELRLSAGHLTATKVKAYRPWETPEGFRIVSDGRSAYVEPAPLLASLAEQSGSRESEMRRRVLETVADDPGIGKRKIGERVKGSQAARDAALAELIESGAVVEHNGARGARHFYLAFGDERADDSAQSRESAQSRHGGEETGYDLRE